MHVGNAVDRLLCSCEQGKAETTMTLENRGAIFVDLCN